MQDYSSLQQSYVDALRAQKLDVNVFLVNGIKLQGRIIAQDDQTLLLKNVITQMIYKNAVSTIVPARNVNLAAAGIQADATE